MQALRPHIETDLLDLYSQNKIQSASRLNAALNMPFISERHQPMYFTGKYDAKTVFVMLNPGASFNDGYSFHLTDKQRFNSFDHYLDQYLYEHIHFGYLDRNRVDNFDIKQAAFLYHFQHTGLAIPDFMSSVAGNREMKLKAKENVLMNKLQLEFIPFRSVEFLGVLDNLKIATENMSLLLPYTLRMLDAITEFPRGFVIFGAKQFSFLFQAYAQLFPSKIKFYETTTFKIDGLKNKVSSQLMSIQHNDTQVNAIIAHSFPRRDLPNAFEKMSLYGACVYQSYMDTFQP